MTTTNDANESTRSLTLAAYLYANDYSIYELLENYPAIEIDDLPPSLRLARGIDAECGGGADAR